MFYVTASNCPRFPPMQRTDMADSEQQRRVCRTCGEGYEYPGHNSLATRTLCARCIEIPESTARVLRILRRRVEGLSKQVDKLKADDAKSQSPDSPTPDSRDGQ